MVMIMMQAKHMKMSKGRPKAKVKEMMMQGADLSACITALLPNATDVDDVAKMLVQGVEAYQEELMKDEDYDWRTELNRALVDRSMNERVQYLINLIR